MVDSAIEESFSPFTEYDIFLFKQGTHFRLYEKLGSRMVTHNGVDGTYFAVWAPNARSVSVIGDFNGWDREANPMHVRYDSSGIWELFIPGIEKAESYKYHIVSNVGGYRVDKGDPFAIHWETPPKTASKVWDLDYEWCDEKWMSERKHSNNLGAPISIYEVHIGSWMRKPEEDNRPLSYTELAEKLPSYVKECGFTHVEFMPVMEHPFLGSWGYQVTGYFAPSSRYGTPQEFKYLVDRLHQEGIGVILDWVPSHFPGDEHGLVFFDGTHLFEHADPRKGFHPDWKSYVFNHGRNEVRAFLISNALYWLREYHADGLRVDAVASMLYLDYSRKEGEWIPNIYGGRENLDSISLLRTFNETVYGELPDTQTYAEESTAWPMVTRPVYSGGLGFGLKWNMGWMHDTLDYISHEAVHRKYHHNQLTFSIWYAFTENYVLPLSHDEVVHGKGSLLGKMPGDDWQKLANLRLLLGYMFTHPGKKLLFMGGEIGQWSEWNHDSSIDWALLDWDRHRGVRQWVADLNNLYRSQPAAHELDFDNSGFRWVDYADSDQSVLSYLRMGKNPDDTLLVCCNFTPVPRHGYRVGVPGEGFWRELINSDAPVYGGSGQGNYGGVNSVPTPSHGMPHMLKLTLPPLATVVLKREK